MPNNSYDLNNISEEPVSIKFDRKRVTLPAGTRESFRQQPLNMDEVASQCVVHINGRRAYKSLLDVDTDIDNDGNVETTEVESDEAEQNESEASDNQVEVEEQDESESDEANSDADENESDEDFNDGQSLQSVLISEFDYSELQSLAGNEDDVDGSGSTEAIAEGLSDKYSYSELEAVLSG